MANEQRDGHALVWEGADLPYVEPGDYQATCVGFQGPEWVRAFRRWSVRLEFCLLSEGKCVSAFFNLGNDPMKLHFRSRSRFYSAWSQANGEPPRKGQHMKLDTFTNPSLLYTVRVDLATKDAKGAEKPVALTYSRVTEILKVEYA